VILAFAVTACRTRTFAQHEIVLHSFGRGMDGAQPSSNLVFDAAGNLYGTTPSGLSTGFGCGTIFKLSPNHNGGWSERLFFAFNSAGACGPAGLTIDSVGNLYGTAGGGSWGTAFEVTPLFTIDREQHVSPLHRRLALRLRSE
jgi:hypothetical protein